ncbi:UNVERIFIED_CONTAM: Inositol hexakisphosphate and diphosphoinositol-pentakisphosphate kinase 2, partial [Gekko kuhli]
MVEEESPLSVSSPECIGTWLHYTSGVGTGRRRRRSGEQITSSPVSPKSLAFTSSIFGSWQQVPPESNSHYRTPRTIVEQKTSGIGSHCAGLFNTTVLGGSSSAPNLQDYARIHRIKVTSSGCIDDTTRGSAVKRFSISFARHPTNGFELYSMVPSICPLETLHNSLSLKQVDDFLASIATSTSCDNFVQISTASFSSPSYVNAISGRKSSLNMYTPTKIQPTLLEDFMDRQTVELPSS